MQCRMELYAKCHMKDEESSNAYCGRHQQTSENISPLQIPSSQVRHGGHVFDSQYVIGADVSGDGSLPVAHEHGIMDIIAIAPLSLPEAPCIPIEMPAQLEKG